MRRQNIILGNYTYILELYRDSIDLSTRRRKNFYMIRNFDILLESITQDKDIYFIEEGSENIIYPMTSTNNVSYSINMNEFSSDLNTNNFDVLKYKFYSDSLKEISLPTDLVRIYLPSIKSDLKAILDIKNNINGINFHYIIKDINTYINNSEIKSNNEFEYNHSLYSQYIDVYIPSLNYLISNNVYIKEYNPTNFDYLENDTNKVYINFNTLFKKFSVEKNSDNVYVKNFVNTNIISELYNVLSVSLYPYEEVDENGIIIPDKDYPMNLEIFNTDLSFTLSSELRFPRVDDFNSEEEFKLVEGFPCIISSFNYKKLIDGSIKDNYLFYSNVSEEEYSDFELDNISDEYDLEENIKKTGFLIEIATDNKFQNIVYKYSELIPEEVIIDNLIFPINSIFESWDNFPTLLAVRIRFIDKVGANIIESNPVLITKEWFKYLLNDSGKRRLHFNKVYFNTINSIETKMVSNLNLDGFNFIDKINCTIIKGNESNSINVSKNSNPKIIYKPIFYKVADLQNIKIISNIKQNIGVNLSEYLGKVETFRLVLGDTEYVESGRNDTFVIFNIAASKLTSSNGKYYILNENSELISTGNYSVE